MKHWFGTLFTTKSGASDTMLTLSAFSVLSYLFCVVYDLVRFHTFDPLATATGLGTVIGAACAGMGLRDKLRGSDNAQSSGN